MRYEPNVAHTLTAQLEDHSSQAITAGTVDLYLLLTGPEDDVNLGEWYVNNDSFSVTEVAYSASHATHKGGGVWSQSVRFDVFVSGRQLKAYWKDSLGRNKPVSEDVEVQVGGSYLLTTGVPATSLPNPAPTGYGADLSAEQIQDIADTVVEGLGSITDPLLNTVPGTYLAGTAGEALGMIAAKSAGATPVSGSLADKLDDLSVSVGGLGTGARSVTITVNDGATALQGAKVRMTNGAESYVGTTNSSGVIAFSLDDKTWTVTISKDGYSFTPTTLVVDGTETQTYSMTLATAPAASSPGYVTGYLYCYDEDGDVESGVSFSLALYLEATAGRSHDSETRTATSSALGLVQFTNLIPGASYMIRRGVQKDWDPISGSDYRLKSRDPQTWRKFTIPAAQTAAYPIPAVVGEE